MTNFNNSSQRSFLSNIPPATKSLLIINIGIWLACALSSGFYNFAYQKFALHFWGGSAFNPFQLVSYMFLHAQNITHILFNMYALFLFGRMIEYVWGTRRFVVFYLVCGVGAGLIQELWWTLSWQHDYIEAIAQLNNTTTDVIKAWVNQGLAASDSSLIQAMADFKTNAMLTVGASGAIFALLVAFAFIFPNIPMYLFFIPVPIKAKWMVLGYGVLELAFGLTNTMGTVAHYAHLGGMLFALILIAIWHKNGTLHGKYPY